LAHPQRTTVMVMAIAKHADHRRSQAYGIMK